MFKMSIADNTTTITQTSSENGYAATNVRITFNTGLFTRLHDLHLELTFPQNSSVSWMRYCTKSTVCLDSTGAMHWCQVETSTYDEGMPIWTGMERRKRVTYCLNCRGSKRCALANVQIHQPLPISASHRFPHFTLVLHSTLSQWIHCFIGDVLAVVEAKGP